MFVVCVTLWAKREHVDQCIEACIKNAHETRKEAGNLRFDFLRCVEPDNQFFLYEVYRTEEDFDFHHKTPHYLPWRTAVEPWMERPRLGVKHQSLSPENQELQWKGAAAPA